MFEIVLYYTVNITIAGMSASKGKEKVAKAEKRYTERGRKEIFS